MRKAHGFYIEHWMIISFLLMAYDAVSIAFSYFFGLWLRYDFKFDAISPYYLNTFRKNIIKYIILYQRQLSKKYLK